ncbi:MAG TPA: cysteine desulfurase family protein [Phycisphaerales bacterium]|nr:cysteine desulfurase family protein [Phycisphaerales bacterium]HRQ74614.1 cysteine desulfurase family protein [Phycisphaerales bacterium]
MTYLDNNATTQPAPSVIEAMARVMREGWANPSSVHRAGQIARQQVELARETVCKLIGCGERELIFTSGGTESINLALRGSLNIPARRLIVTDKVEHSAMRETAETLGAQNNTEILWLKTNIDGVIQLEPLRELIESRHDAIAIVSIGWANNETGVIQPVEAIGSLCRSHGVKLHIDGTQWVGKMPTNVSSLPIDMMSFSAHKFHGPKGIGGLFVRRGVRVLPQITGGPHERERRGGTENVPGIVGMGEAARLALEWLANDHARTSLEALRNRFEQSLLSAVPDASINGAALPETTRLWNTSNVAFPRLEAEAILLLLSERGVYASAGAACSSGSLDPSPVLLAMGIPEERAHGSVRFSLSRDTTVTEIDSALRVIPQAIARLRASMSSI